MTKMTQKQAQVELDRLTTKAEEMLGEAEGVATEYGLEFSFSPAYGMGGWFESGEWSPSSQSC